MDSLPSAPSAPSETPDETIPRLTAELRRPGAGRRSGEPQNHETQAMRVIPGSLFFGSARSYVIRKGEEAGMADAVMVEIPLTPEAAEALGDPERRERIGRLVSSILRPQSPGDDPLAGIFASIKRAARDDGLTDEEIEAELAAYNAERRL